MTTRLSQGIFWYLLKLELKFWVMSNGSAKGIQVAVQCACRSQCNVFNVQELRVIWNAAQCM